MKPRDQFLSKVYVAETAYMSWTDDSAVPVAHQYIVAVFQSVRARAIPNAFLSLLELFE